MQEERQQHCCSCTQGEIHLYDLILVVFWYVVVVVVVVVLTLKVYMFVRHTITKSCGA